MTNTEAREALEEFLKWTGEGEQTPNWEEFNNDHFILKWLEKYNWLVVKALEALQPKAVGVPDGYALVPIEPTPQQYEAGQKIITQTYHSHQCEEVYKAMVSACLSKTPETEKQDTLNGESCGQWLPIETAPKIGQWYFVNIAKYQGSNFKKYITIIAFADSIDDEGVFWISDQDGTRVFPTHWMPLPTPPQEKEER